MFQLSTG
ncbi:hypothetical protein HID58_024073 [Brassica napus]|nr:hypothetical protein HID58_024073 [Brassica napus]